MRQPRSPGGAPLNAEIAADGDERAADAKRVERFDGLTRRIPLADAADVQRHAGHVERHRAPLRIEVKLAEAGARRRVPQRRGLGHPSRSSRLAPQCNDRRLRDVEGATRCLGQFLRCAQHREQVLAHRHGAVHGRLRDAIQLAVRLVVGEDGVEVADAIEGDAKGGLRGWLVRRVDRDPHQRAHVRLNRFVAV